MIDLLVFVYAFLGGLLPAMLWLWFFNHEDPHPEPRSRLIKTFVAGMITVIIAMALEEIIRTEFTGGVTTATTLLSWAFVEEGLKFGAAWLVALHTRIVDEPIDALIYMVAVALGFAALENTLFLLIPISESAWMSSLLSGGMRFVGATLVHVVSSGVLGAFIAESFYYRRRIQYEAIVAGLVAATLLHWGFNLLIMEVAQATVLRVFGIVWVGVIGLMLAFEHTKRIKKPAPYSSPNK